MRWLLALLLPFAAFAGERGLFVAVGDDGRRLVSRDGQLWEDNWRVNGGALLDVAYGAKRFVAVGGNAKSGRILTCTDGRDWRELPPVGSRVATIAFGNGRFIAVHDGGELLISRDGLIFAPGARLDWPGEIHPRRSACGDTEAGFRTVVIGDLDLRAEHRRTSWRGVTSDGARWEARALDTPPATDIAYGSGHFVIVGPGGLIESSHDGETWTRRDTAPNAGNFDRIVWTGRQFVVGGSGIAWTSPDGFEWKAGNFRIPCSLAWAGEDGTALGVSWDGTLHRSAGLQAWERLSLPTGPALNAIAFGDPSAAP